jgi:DNA repair protein RecO (recombination protein O)
MTRMLSDVEGYVVHLSAYKDNDAMVNVFSEEGEVSFLGRGIQKTTSKNAASCQLLSYSRFSLETGKGGGYSLKEGISLKPADGKDSLERLTSFSLIAELCSKLIQEDEAKESYPWLKATMEALDQSADAFTVSLIFFAHILIIAGYGLNVDECIYCQSKSNIKGVSYSDGGFVCANEMDEGAVAMDPRHLKILRYIFRCGIVDITRVSFTKDECQGFFRSLSQYLADLTGVELKSVELLLKA